MKFPADIRVYGDLDYRDKKCPLEVAEQMTFFNRVRKTEYGAIATHIRNEGKRTNAMKERMEGMTPGASDIIIPSRVPFVCEMKRRDHTLCHWQKGQLDYLREAERLGAFTVVALGVDAAWEAFQEWILITKN
jgi:hypothetical protein